MCIYATKFLIFIAFLQHRVAIGLMLSINHLYEMPVIRPSFINPSNSSLSGTVPKAIYDITSSVTPDARLSSNVIYASPLLPLKIIIITSTNSSFNSCQSLKIHALYLIRTKNLKIVYYQISIQKKLILTFIRIFVNKNEMCTT